MLLRSMLRVKGVVGVADWNRGSSDRYHKRRNWRRHWYNLYVLSNADLRSVVNLGSVAERLVVKHCDIEKSCEQTNNQVHFFFESHARFRKKVLGLPGRCASRTCNPSIGPKVWRVHRNGCFATKVPLAIHPD